MDNSDDRKHQLENPPLQIKNDQPTNIKVDGNINGPTQPPGSIFQQQDFSNPYVALIPKAANTVKERSRSKEALTSDRKEEGFEFLTLSADGGNDEKEEVSNGASLKSESSKGQSQGIS